MSENWSCTIINAGHDIELAQLDDLGQDWFADGPGGAELGDLHHVLTSAAGPDADAAWLGVVESTITSELGAVSRSQLLVTQVTGRWFHATFSRNRQSIQAHGLDHRLMVAPGIAGSTAAEAAGVFLCRDREMARWFARIGSSRGTVDTWGVELSDAWLVGDPGDGGGGDDSWMIHPGVIDAQQLILLEKDVNDPLWPS